MSTPSVQTAERTSADGADGTPIGATVCRLVLPDDLTADIGSVQLELAAKDASPIAAGAISLSLTAAPTASKDGLGFRGLGNRFDVF